MKRVTKGCVHHALMRQIAKILLLLVALSLAKTVAYAAPTATPELDLSGTWTVTSRTVDTNKNQAIRTGTGRWEIKRDGKDKWKILTTPISANDAADIQGSEEKAVGGTPSWQYIATVPQELGRLQVQWLYNGAPLGPAFSGTYTLSSFTIEGPTYFRDQTLAHIRTVINGTRASGPEPSQLQLQALDGNPAFIYPNIPTEYRNDPVKKALYTGTKRIGAAADGVSLLILRAKVEEAGKATLSLEGSEAGGELLPITADPWRTPGSSRLEVSTVKPFPDAYNKDDPTDPNKNSPYVLALYKPPLNYGRSYASRPSREFKVKLSFQPEKGGAAQDAECLLRLVRPPVLLVHGTFDDPTNCWRMAGMDSSTSLSDRLSQEGYVVLLADYKATNGSSDPSGFVTNQKVVWDNNGAGIKDALEVMRRVDLAVTQADLVCHSLGGVLARVYAKGKSVAPFNQAVSTEHFTDPEKCQECWYHRRDNFFRGDIHRLVTISSTHMGSDICRLMATYDQYTNEHGIAHGHVPTNFASLWTTIFLTYVDAQKDTAIFTGAFKDQIPGSSALQSIGPTRVPAHAIACIADDDKLDLVVNKKDESYQQRLEKIWKNSRQATLKWAFEHMGQPQDAKLLVQLSEAEADIEAELNEASSKVRLGYESAEPRAELRRKELAYKRRMDALALRAAVFGNTPNDCTVRQESSLGGLKPPYTTILPNVLHGYAPRYKSVQNRVVELLQSDESSRLFDPNGFPAAGGLPANLPPSGSAAKPKNSPPFLSPVAPSPVAPSPTVGTLPKVGSAAPAPWEGTIGIHITPGLFPKIAAVIENSPAAQAGVPVGTWIIKVDGQSTRNLPAKQVAALIHGSAGTSVTLTVSDNPFGDTSKDDLPLGFFPQSIIRDIKVTRGGGAPAVGPVSTAPTTAPPNRPTDERGDGNGSQAPVHSRPTVSEGDRKKAQEHYNKGIDLADDDKWMEAEAEFRQALQLDPTLDYDAWEVLGETCFKQKKWAAAVAAYREALRQEPDFGQLHAELAHALLRQGKGEEALKEAQEARRLGQENHPVYKELGLKK
jgi:hypothetical protein